MKVAMHIVSASNKTKGGVMRTYKIILKTVFLAIICVTVAACGSSSSSGTAAGDDSRESSGGDDTVLTTAGSAFPIDLVITSPYTTDSSASSSISASVALRAVEDFSTERVELQTIIAGDEASDCNFTLDIFSSLSASPACYGPQLKYLEGHHPDGNLLGGDTVGTLPTGDLGIWNETQDTEACAAAQMNYLIDSVGAIVDSSVSIFASMGCSLNVSGDDLPAVGESLDMKISFESIISQNSISGVTVSSATIARSANDGDGNAVYDFVFTGTLAGDSDTIPVELYLRHIPLDDDNATYKGKLSFIFRDEVDLAPNDELAESDTHAGSVLYHKSSATAMVVRMMEAQYRPPDEENADPLIEATKDIDPTVTNSEGSEENQTNGWNNNFNYALMSINPQDGTGSFAYAWAAGTGGIEDPEDSRVFNVTVSADDDGTKSGCAYFGFGPAPAENNNLGSIDGFICNWAGPGNARTYYDLVQRQCVIQNDDGVFISDESEDLNLTYAPVNSCDYAGGDFQWGTDNNLSEDVMSNDNVAGAAVTNNLLDVNDIVFTMPTAPDDVY